MQKKINIKFVHIVAAPEATAFAIEILREQRPSNQTLLTITATTTRITFVACTIIILLRFDAFKLLFIAQIAFINVIPLILVFALVIEETIHVAMLIAINGCAAAHDPTSGIGIKLVVLINIVDSVVGAGVFLDNTINIIIEIEILMAIVIVYHIFHKTIHANLQNKVKY